MGYDSVYIIEAERLGVAYIILSKDDFTSDSLCKKTIEVEQSYPLVLKQIDTSWYREKIESEKYLPGDINAGINYNGTFISFRKFSYILYTTPSLVGLCLWKDYKNPMRREIKH
ncbi:hypothetical protein M2132_001923 [Dysgonomonas sp. PH5-45]|uniref:hypothetical protein n=1 Tax=unclassified Dysgonomonas TaxID=2630389 RepID=UPI002472E9EC|nr:MULTISPECIES: hypothetical protein [unclassified Dysgonomonas]MDH6355578.1 hypothetical protein [Dysgonomonas sp. PH5-45]MDH6388475.1 hypothetical protein [Dysgonomonas sp. PH5-37]